MKSSGIKITELNVQVGDRLVFEFQKSKDCFNIDYIEFKYRDLEEADSEAVNHLT